MDTDFSGTKDSARACPDPACFNFAFPYIRNRLKCNNRTLAMMQGWVSKWDEREGARALCM